MSIPNYLRPQMTIKQILDVVQFAAAGTLNAIVIGGKYLLSRYGKETLPATGFLAAGQTLTYDYLDSNGATQTRTNEIVDLASVKVYMTGGRVNLATFDSITPTEVINIKSNLEPHILRMMDTSNFAVSGTPTNPLASEFADRSTAVGDVVVIDPLGTPIERKVVALQSSTGSTTDFDEVVLDGPAVDTSVDNAGVELDVNFYLDYTGELDSGEYNAPTAASVVVPAGAAYDVPGRTGADVAFEDAIGELSVSFRALIPSPASETYRSYSTTTEIIEDAGPIDLDNDYAYALSRALKGAQGIKVYGVSVASQDTAGYSAAFDKISHTDTVYALCVLSSDSGVRDALVSHVDLMSGEEKKNFRRAYVGTDSPGEYKVLEKEDDGTDLLVTAAEYGGAGGDVRFLTIEGDAPSLVGLVKPGYLVRFDGDSNDYEVETVYSATELLLTASGTYPAAGSAKITEFWAPDTARTQADYLIDQAQALNSRRVASVWVEDGTATVGGEVRSIASQFVAAEIAGLRSAVSPHIGLTRTEITTVTNAPAMYTRYSADLLDEIAAAGTFIVTQDAESGAVYIRHQLTTEVDKGALYYEDSVGVNIDDICLDLKSIEQKYIGKKNVTPATLGEIKADVFDNLFDRTQAAAGNPDGPALVGFDDLVVSVDPIYKDTVNVTVTVFVGLPLNRIAITVTGSIQFD